MAAKVRRYWWVVAEAVLLLSFIGYRIGAAASYSPGVWQDSENYKRLAGSSLTSTQLWFGSRSPLVPVLMKLTGSYDGYALLQGVLGGIAWAILAYTVSRLLPASWRKPLVTMIVLGFASSPLIVMWDGSALSESPSLSVLALLCASGIWLMRRFTWCRVATFGLCALVYCGLRDADIFTTAIVGLALVGIGLSRWVQGVAVDASGASARLRANWVRTRRPTAVGAVLLVVAGLTGGAAGAAHRSPNIEDAFAVRIFPYPQRTSWFTAQGMPQGNDLRILALNAKPAPGTAPVVLPNLHDQRWAALKTWLARDGQTEYELFLFLHPVYVLTAPLASPELSFNDANGNVYFYEPTGYPLAAWLGELFTPSRVVELGLAAVGVGFAVRRRVWRSGWWRFTAVFGGVGVVSMLLAWHGEGMEATRHTVEGNVEARLAVLLCVVVSVLATSGARRPAVQSSMPASEFSTHTATEVPVARHSERDRVASPV